MSQWTSAQRHLWVQVLLLPRPLLTTIVAASWIERTKMSWGRRNGREPSNYGTLLASSSLTRCHRGPRLPSLIRNEDLKVFDKFKRLSIPASSLE
jgi:hypothetical protein